MGTSIGIGIGIVFLNGTSGPQLIFNGNAATVPEDTATSSSLGTFSVAGGSGTYTYAITAGNGAGKFSISAATLVLAGALDYETTTSYALTITADNGVDPVLTLHQPINVGNVAEKPVNLTLPVITGTAAFGNTLTGSNGTWTDQSGATYAYRWFANAVAIGGATANTFVVTHSQEGTTITFGVIATNTAASSDEAVSAATATVPDATAPTVSSFSPLDDATGVSNSGNLAVTFSENVSFHTAVVISLRKTSDDSVVQAFTEADIGGALSISTTTLTINPTNDLADTTGYYVLIGATSIKDAAGNFFGGISSKTTWNFTSGSAVTGIAFDAATGANNASASSLTYSHTVGSGANRALVVVLVGAVADQATGVTYNGVAMTLVAKIVAARTIYAYYLNNPAAGAHNVVASFSASQDFCLSSAASYTGVLQSGQPEVFNTNSNAASPGSTSLTTLTDNDWTVLCVKAENGSPAASTGSTKRVDDAFGGVGVTAIFDSNGPIHPAGSYSMAFTQAAGGINALAVMLALAPA